MRHLFASKNPLIGLGMTSLVLGTVGLLLFFLPVLGIPLSAIGLLCGVLRLFQPAESGTTLRWGVGGVAVSCLALAVNVGVAFAPAGYLPGRKVPRPWQAVPDRPYVPPPARPQYP